MFNKFVSLVGMFLGLGDDVISVVTGTTGVPGGAGSLASDQQTYFSAKLLEVAVLMTILDQFGDKDPIPSNSSKTIQFNRLEKLATSTTPTQLIEGVSPDAIGLQMSQFTAVAEQYGIILRLSDLAELTSKHDIVGRALYVLGLQAAETYDILIFNVLSNTSGTIYRPNSKTSNATTTASDKIGYVDMTALHANLMDQGGRPFDDGDYVLVVAPQVNASLLQDPDFKASNQFGKPERIWRGEVNELTGFRVVKTNAPGFAFVAQTTSGAANKLYYSFAIARNAYQISDLQNLRVYAAAPGGQTDVLQQNRKIGYKFAFKTVITNQNWITPVISAGQNSINN
jgi:N4-gp56 family major capsid protein